MDGRRMETICKMLKDCDEVVGGDISIFSTTPNEPRAKCEMKSSLLRVDVGEQPRPSEEVRARPGERQTRDLFSPAKMRGGS